MTATGPIYIGSRDNPLLKELRQLSQDSTAYRKLGRVWIEGDHLCRAALARGQKPELAVYAESFWPLALHQLTKEATKNIVIPDRLFAGISGLESPSGMGFVLNLGDSEASGQIVPGLATVVLDRVQDAGNVGSVLRSAAALGFAQVVALKGTAALWAPKVLRAGMGAHFALRLVEGCGPDALAALGVPLIVTSSHQGVLLHQQVLPWPCAWAFGHEGQGVGEALMAQAALSVRIDQPGGEESLNVAAAAAICLYASAASRLPAQPV